MHEIDDVRPPLSRDEVDLRVATHTEADGGQLLWTSPRLYIRFKRNQSPRWVYRYTFAGKDRWLILGGYSDYRSGDEKLTYGAAQEITWKLGILRKHAPDLHALRQRVISELKKS